ncbi:hypothetical protein HNR63_000200 [Anoxybacillus kamchatkensis]|uniref:SLAP domain-containing protein n=1 Tax=Anoxybacillus ayderensis TaxID=265546 RepID=UPI0015EB73E3|nr:SLAP domain-containing protein [Anoxybacillus ayderensis]MBA2877173.1 hypothetical protein [Anoxybacillus ayderensis]
MKKFFPFLLLLLLFHIATPAEASMKWGSVEVKKGVIGKIVTLRPTGVYEQKGKQLVRKYALKKGVERPVYNVVKQDGKTFYQLDKNEYVPNDTRLKYTPLHEDTMKKLIKRSMRGAYELVIDENQRASFFIEKQNGNYVKGTYVFAGTIPLMLEGQIQKDNVRLRVYFDDRTDAIRLSISYLKQVMSDEQMEQIAQQLTNNDDYYFEIQFPIKNDPEQFIAQVYVMDIWIDDRFNVVGTKQMPPITVSVRKKG